MTTRRQVDRAESKLVYDTRHDAAKNQVLAVSNKVAELKEIESTPITEFTTDRNEHNVKESWKTFIEQNSTVKNLLGVKPGAQIPVEFQGKSYKLYLDCL